MPQIQWLLPCRQLHVPLAAGPPLERLLLPVLVLPCMAGCGLGELPRLSHWARPWVYCLGPPPPHHHSTTSKAVGLEAFTLSMHASLYCFMSCTACCALLAA
jgi:hypothetical protein